jgi:misacylated tRNA(Ala) deacylase
MTGRLYEDEAYLPECEAVVIASGPDGVLLDRTVFYPMGGGQPGDTGALRFDGKCCEIRDTRQGQSGGIVHLPAAGAELPGPGQRVRAEIDWERRYLLMRMHPGLHLLGIALPYGVTGGNISANRSRLDFDMAETADKAEVNARLRRLVAEDHPVRSFWITEEELESRPELIRTLSVRPPRGVGRIRLLEIAGLDLQPCGGTHVRRTGEVGALVVAKIEKKGRRNRRVYVRFDRPAER